MKRLFILLFLLAFTVNAWAVQFPKRMINDVDGTTLNLASDGRLNSNVVDTSGNEVVVQADGDLNVAVKTGSSVISGQVHLHPSGTAKVLGSTAIKQVQLIEHATNSVGLIWAGPSTVSSTNGCRVSSTNYLILNVDNLSDVYVIGTYGNVVSYIAIVE